MKRALVFFLCILMIVSVAACAAKAPTGSVAQSEEPAKADQPVATQQPAKATEAPAPEKLVVAGVVLHEDQQHKIFQKGMEDAAKDAGCEFMPGMSQTDPAKEVELINTYLAKGVDGLAIIPINPESSVVTLKQATEKGMKVAILDNPLVDNSFVSGTVISDNFKLGAATGKEAKTFIEKNLDGKATIFALGYKSLMPESSGPRLDGFMSEVSKLPGVKLVDYQDAWVQDKALQVASDMLTAHPDANIIYACNEGGTIGATMAVAQANKKGKVYVFGIDASDQIIQMLKDPANILQATTAQNSYQLGYDTMKILIMDLKGEDVSAYKNKVTMLEGAFLPRSDPKALDDFVAKIKQYSGN